MITETDIDNIIKTHHQWAVRGGITRVQSPYNPKLRAQALRFLRWCEQNGIEDPKLYVDAQCEFFLQKTGRVQHLAFMPSQKALENWKRWVEGFALQKRADQRLNETLQSPSAPTEKKIRPHQEKFKSYYIRRVDTAHDVRRRSFVSSGVGRCEVFRVRHRLSARVAAAANDR
jgi:hypothetical protein